MTGMSSIRAITLLFPVMTACGVVRAAGPEFDAALELREEQKYREALVQAEAGAAKNDADCLNLIGEFYLYGHLGGETFSADNTAKAKPYFEKAVAAGHREARFQLAQMTDDVAAKLRLLLPLAEAERYTVAEQVALIYERGAPGVPADKAAAIRYYRIAASGVNATPGEKKGYEERAARLEKPVTTPVAVKPAPVSAKPAVAPTPVAPAKPKPAYRVFAESPDFAGNLTGHWEIRCHRTDWRNDIVNIFRVTQAGRYSATLLMNPDAPTAKSYGMRIEESYSQADAYTHRIVRIVIGDMTLKSYYIPRSRSFSGDVVVGGYVRGNWSAKRRLDLDYADAGRTALKAKEYDAALHYLNEAVRLLDDASNRFDRGCAYYAVRNNAEAAADFRAVLKTKPDDLPARMNLMMALYYGGEHAAALPECDRLIARVPALSASQLGTVRFFRADTLWYLDRKEDAERDYAAALAADPSLKDRRRAAATREGALHVHLKSSAAIAETMSNLHKANAKAAAELREANRRMKDVASPKTDADDEAARARRLLELTAGDE